MKVSVEVVTSPEIAPVTLELNVQIEDSPSEGYFEAGDRELHLWAQGSTRAEALLNLLRKVRTSLRE